MPPSTSDVRHIHGQANQLFYVLQGALVIEVDGTLEQPNQPTTKVLPALNDSLRQLFPELIQPETRSRPIIPRLSGSGRSNQN